MLQTHPVSGDNNKNYYYIDYMSKFRRVPMTQTVGEKYYQIYCLL